MITLNAVYPVEGSINRPYIFKTNSTNNLAGQMRYNLDLNRMEIFDGTAWQSYEFNLNISLDTDTIDVINWARAQRDEQKRMQELCKKYPGIADVKEKLDLMIALVKEKEDA